MKSKPELNRADTSAGKHSPYQPSGDGNNRSKRIPSAPFGGDWFNQAINKKH
jgi:hypothetical protein